MPVMTRIDFRVGEVVLFGRHAGEQTYARIERLNPKRAKVRTLESRGVRNERPAGQLWNVTYSLLRKVDPEQAAKFDAGQPPATVPFTPSGPHPIGLSITDVRRMTTQELDAEGWESGYGDLPMAIVLSDGTILYASQDPEGNGPGALFGKHPSRGAFIVS